MAMRICLMLLCCATAIGFGQTPQSDQKMLYVKEIKHQGEADLGQVAQLLEEQVPLHTVGTVNWEAFPYRPEVKFRIAHSNNQIWLTFYVQEENVLAKRTETNSATHRDSCVEFFLDPDQSGNYYNFEFNCIGVTHLAYGPDRSARTFVDAALIQKEIKTASSLGNRPFEERTGGHVWQMTVVVPSAIFVHQENIQLKHLNAKANFYKCADDTSQRHYLSWNPIKTERPDFHQPAYFGNLVFE
jgi:hypothetical protein